MPLRVTVELDRGNDQREKLAEIFIGNIGGSLNRGDYVVKVLQGPKSRRRFGKVLQHRRLAEPVWTLVAKAIESLGFGVSSSERH